MSWLVHDSEIAIPEYVLYRLDRLVKIRGGVCVFVKEFYKVKTTRQTIIKLKRRF